MLFVSVGGLSTYSFNPWPTGFEVALFKTVEDQRAKNTGDYHNPTRQRGIYGNTCKTRQLNPSLTFRVVMVANAQLQNLSATG